MSFFFFLRSFPLSPLKKKKLEKETRNNTYHKDHGVIVDAPVVLDRQPWRLRIILSQDPQLDARVLLQGLGRRTQLGSLSVGQETRDVEDRRELFGEELGLVNPFEPGVGGVRERGNGRKGKGGGEGDGNEARGEERRRRRGC